jgi:hypothetical protein
MAADYINDAYVLSVTLDSASDEYCLKYGLFRTTPAFRTRKVPSMISLPDTPTEVLLRRKLIFEQKIVEERRAMRAGSFGPGNPVECAFIVGESRRERLIRWESTVIAINRVIADL